MKKWCKKCKSLLSIKKFGIHSTTKTGYRSYCKNCTRIHNKQLSWIKRYKALEYYSRGKPKCSCCGETKLEFLSFDHINGGGSKHIRDLRKIGITRLENFLIRNNFPKGFRILCHNCNFSIGHYGICPHKNKGIILNYILTFKKDNKNPLRKKRYVCLRGHILNKKNIRYEKNGSRRCKICYEKRIIKTKNKK